LLRLRRWSRRVVKESGVEAAIEMQKYVAAFMQQRVPKIIKAIVPQRQADHGNRFQ
jgi:hypothetical protein